MNELPFADEVRKCREAQLKWSALTVRERLRPVKAFRRALVTAADELTAAVEADVGRPPAEVLGSDVLPLAAACKFLEAKAATLLALRRVASPPIWLLGQSDTVRRRPWGVVGIIGTWNYPLLLNGVQIVQALVAGNGVVWKPSELGARSAAVLARLLTESGLPADLLQVLPATREAGPALIEADIDHLIFTGSAAVGRQIARRLGERLIPSTLELSGIDAMFVLADADPVFAAKAAWFGVTLNRGQTCLAVRRIFVDRAVLPPFVEALRTLVESSSPMTVVTEGQAEQAKRMLADAVAKGGRELKPPIGTAAIILDATPAMDLCRVECFAPIAAVLPFNSMAHALELEAECSYALGASVFTNDRSKAAAIARRLRVGSVSINDVIAPTAHPATPFGGTGTSGWGVTRGAEGLLAMTVLQVQSTRSGKYRPHYDAVPGDLLTGMLAATHGSGIGVRLRGVRQMIRGLIASLKK